MGMLRTLMRRRSPHPDVVVVHSAPCARESIFGFELHAAQRQLAWLDYREHHTRPHGRLAPADLGRLCPD